MTATLLDGSATAKAIREELTERVSRLRDAGVIPGLGTLIVGDDPGSHAYVAGKHRDCAAVGLASIQRELPADATQAEVEAVVDELNADPDCTGFIVQLPLPRGLDEQALLARIDPTKDADGLHPTNLGRLVLDVAATGDAPLPCTPRGIVELLRRYDVPIGGAHVVIVGRGTTSGRPLGLLLTRRTENATVTLCHTGTRDLADLVRTGDIVVACAGSAGLVTAEMVRPGAVVLDVGTTRVVGEDGQARIVGDVADDVREVAGYLAPMPGGVGPMTRAMLLANVVDAAEAQLRTGRFSVGARSDAL